MARTATSTSGKTAQKDETQKTRKDLVTKVGNLGADPELRETPNGKKVCNFSIAVHRKMGDDKVTEWYDITTWEDLAENVSVSLAKGDRVIVHGIPSIEEFDKNDGTKGKQKKINAWNVGLELSYITVKEVVKSEKSYSNNDTDGFDGDNPF